MISAKEAFSISMVHRKMYDENLPVLVQAAIRAACKRGETSLNSHLIKTEATYEGATKCVELLNEKGFNNVSVKTTSVGFEFSCQW